MSSEAISLYRNLLRYSARLAGYNFRQYALRRTRDAFLSNRSLTDPAEIQREVEKGRQQLEVVKRQSAISQMYKGDRLVVEQHARQLRK
ncbi:protein Isd11p [Trichomonascus vanleenenianus]|uniref:Isd11p n=1 Tax=Trichomonascus vanleenenianus TaxID=2268995 RepID=UPI003ECB7A3C